MPGCWEGGIGLTESGVPTKQGSMQSLWRCRLGVGKSHKTNSGKGVKQDTISSSKNCKVCGDRERKTVLFCYLPQEY